MHNHKILDQSLQNVAGELNTYKYKGNISKRQDTKVQPTILSNQRIKVTMVPAYTFRRYLEEALLIPHADPP